MKTKLSIAVLIAAMCAALAQINAQSSSERVQQATLFVAPNGNDVWSGKIAEPNVGDGPFLTIQRARDEIRKIKKSGGLPNGGIVVDVRGGTYELAATLTLAAEDSGEPGKPIVYRGRKGEEVRILGGRVVTGWQPVTDPAVLAKLDESARGKVLQADLKSQKITDLGKMNADTAPGLEVFFQNVPMTLARWPNEGFAKIKKALGPTTLPKIENMNVRKEGIFSYEGDRPRRWIGQPDIMLHGYWCWDWADQRLKAESIDPEKRIITLAAKPEHGYGFREGQWFYAYNLLSEIDRPGEWYLDRVKGILYFWPPASVEQGRPTVSVLQSLVEMNGASHVTLSGLLLEICRGTAVTAKNADDVRIVGCTIRNTGSEAVSILGRESSVVGCDIYGNGDGGVSLSGGDRKTLTPSGLAVDNNHIHHYGRISPTYHAAVYLDGVGNRVTHNLIDNAPHNAILFRGNDHLIEFNEIHSVCCESNDAGAIYAGRNWTMRGNVIRNNYLHDINGYEGRGCTAVYFDDQMSSGEISGNLFVRVYSATAICGGRDTAIENNIFVDCKLATYVDARGLSWPLSPDHLDLFTQMKEGLDQVPYQGSLWAKRYPKLANILSDDPMAPLGNVIARNICIGGRWDNVDSAAKPRVKFQDNLLKQDPHFVDAEHGNYQLKDDSPAWKLGFKRIPLEKIGLYESEDRASWPVSHTVRPAGKPPVKPVAKPAVKRAAKRR
jgi:hypothetical protein